MAAAVFRRRAVAEYDVDRPEQPGDVGHDGHGVWVYKMQEVESAERKQQPARQGNVAAPQHAPQEEPHACHHQRIGEQQFGGKSDLQREQPVEQQVQGMVRAA